MTEKKEFTFEYFNSLEAKKGISAKKLELKSQNIHYMKCFK